MEQESAKICSACYTENRLEAKQCVRCGAMFKEDETLRTSDLWPRGVMTRRLMKFDIPPVSMIALHIVGRGTPILLESKAQITLGRFTPGQVSPTVDLTPYHGGLMGVSRQHARIYRRDGHFTIEDLESTNGTWVNEVQLAPQQEKALKSGDQIRLGQFIFYVSFAE